MFDTSLAVDANNFALLTTGVAESALTKFLSRSLGPTISLATEKDNDLRIKMLSLLELSVNSAFLTELSTQTSVRA